MIGRIKGLIVEKQPPEVLVDVNGVGYEISMPMTCFYELGEANQEVTIWTHFVVREDAQLLYGFNNKQERALFRELIKVNGVGPKLALGVLSGVSATQFVGAVEREDVALLVKLPGVGKKTAERLIVEMKDRFKGLTGELFNQDSESIIPTRAPKVDDVESEAVSALIALGYRPTEASRLVSKVVKADMDAETLIREALRSAM